MLVLSNVPRNPFFLDNLGLRLHRIPRDLFLGVKTIITYLKSSTQICLFTVEPLWGYDDDYTYEYRPTRRQLGKT